MRERVNPLTPDNQAEREIFLETEPEIVRPEWLVMFFTPSFLPALFYSSLLTLEGTSTSLFPLVAMLDTNPARSICSINRAARL
jgi:hypothetical protein